MADPASQIAMMSWMMAELVKSQVQKGACEEQQTR